MHRHLRGFSHQRKSRGWYPFSCRLLQRATEERLPRRCVDADARIRTSRWREECDIKSIKIAKLLSNLAIIAAAECSASKAGSPMPHDYFPCHSRLSAKNSKPQNYMRCAGHPLSLSSSSPWVPLRCRPGRSCKEPGDNTKSS